MNEGLDNKLVRQAYEIPYEISYMSIQYTIDQKTSSVTQTEIRVKYDQSTLKLDWKQGPFKLSTQSHNVYKILFTLVFTLGRKLYRKWEQCPAD